MNKKRPLAIISPDRAGLYCIVIYLIFTIATAGNYSTITGEPNLMLLDWHSAIFVTSCILSYIAGLRLYYFAGLRNLTLPGLRKFALNANFYYLLPMCLSTSILLFQVCQLITSNSLISLFLSNVASQDLKGELEVSGTFFNAIYVHLAVTFWSASAVYSNDASRFLKIVRFIMIGVVVVASSLILARYILLPFLAGLLILRVRYKYIEMSKVPLRGLIVAGISIILLFCLIAVARGGEWLSGLYNYGPASFNRLSGILDGRIQLQVPKQFYLLSSLKENWDYYDITINEHDAVAQGGLDWSLNWLTAYGYVFHSLAYFSFLYFSVIGFICGMAWQSFVKGNSWGLVFYPWLLTSILLWFTYNILGYAQTYIVLLVGITLAIYSSVFKPKLKQ